MTELRATHCPICSAAAAPLARAVVLGKFDIQYLRCSACRYTYTEEPYWLAEAYSTAMTDCDLGPVHRCIETSEITRSLLLTCFDPRRRYLDYGGGYGLLVRRMRDLGFDFRYYDRYPSNIFAKGFEAVELSGYELMTAFEVIEHLVNPVTEIPAMLAMSPSLLFSTNLLPPDLPKPGDWWYYALEHGQHVSFHTRQSLEVLARRFNKHLVTDGAKYHLLTDKSIRNSVFSAVIASRTRVVIGEALSKVRAIRSLLPYDHDKSFADARALLTATGRSDGDQGAP